MELEKKLLSVDEAVVVTGIKRSRLYEMLTSGEIVSFTVGRSRKIPATAIDDFIAKKLAGVRSEPVGAA